MLIGLNGFLLGGYIVLLVVSFEEGFVCVIFGVLVVDLIELLGCYCGFWYKDFCCYIVKMVELIG